jgi:Ca2+:H+ antiporter
VWGDSATFAFSLLAICPLAERLGFITEQLAEYTSDTIGGLLNATFGNATEVIVSLTAMRAGLLRVTQLSLLGSILSNMLLVLGCSFFFGGMRHMPEQRFTSSGATAMNIDLLYMAVIATALPSLLSASNTQLHGSASIVTLSRISSCVMVVVYACAVVQQLRAHPEPKCGDPNAIAPAEDDTDGKDKHREAATEPRSSRATGDAPSARADGGAPPAEPASVAASGGDDDELVLTFRTCIGALAVVTALIGVLSGYLVATIEAAADAWGVPLTFISVILLPIVGNASEHASAIMFALKNKLDVALGICVGSSSQIACGVTPACVLFGMLMGQPLTLDLQPFDTGALIFGVLCVSQALAHGVSTWLTGATLVAAYVVLAAAFAVHGDPQLQREHVG